MKKTILTLLIISAFGCSLFITDCFSQSNWILQSPLPTRNSLKEIIFLNQNTGYACALNGIIIKTTNGGINWITL
ncbi:MAG TPA: hypothetical protein VIK14_06275, partial [Ignavibacteria bacterium]